MLYQHLKAPVNPFSLSGDTDINVTALQELIIY